MAKALGHLLRSEAWRILVTLAVLGISAGLTFGMMYLPCHQDFCLYDSDPDARWVTQVALIVYYCVLFAYVVFAWGEERFMKRKIRLLGLSLPQWGLALCAVLLFLFSWGYFAAEFYITLDSNPFYKGWMNENWVRRPAYYATQVTGGVVAPILGLAVLTASKNSCNSFFLPHDEALPFHRWLSWAFVLISILHIAVYFYSAAVDVTQSFWSHVLNTYEAQYAAAFEAPMSYTDWGMGNWMAPLGTYGTLVLIIPTVFCIPFLRRHVYNWFYFTHWMMMAGFVLLCLHSTWDFYFSLPGLCLLVFDWAVRLWVRFTPLDIVKVDLDQPNDMVRIDFDVSKRPDLVSFTGGQFVRVCVPFPILPSIPYSLRALEWHPLSLAAKTSDTTWSLLADSRNGDWKKLLSSHLEEAASGATHLATSGAGKADSLDKAGEFLAPEVASSKSTRPRASPRKVKASRVIIEGPYGSVPFRTETLERVLCLAAGSGITPCLSLAREHPGKVVIAWSIRSAKTDVSGELFQGVNIQVYQTSSPILDEKDKLSSDLEKASPAVLYAQPGKASDAEAAKPFVGAEDSTVYDNPFMGTEDGTVAAGRIPFAKMLEEHLGKLQCCGVYICGPPQFRKVAEAYVRAFELSKEGLAVDVYVESYYY